MAMTRGRPMKKTEAEIEIKLRPYFERNLSATFAAQETGHNIKTVCNYFNKWSQEITRFENKDFFTRQVQERQSIVLALDHLIFEEHEILAELKSEVRVYQDKHKSIPKYFTSSIQNCIKTIAELIEKKTPYTLIPPSTDIIEKCVQQYLEKKSVK